MNIAEIMAIHPAPWRQQNNGSIIRVFDARNQHVELFTLLDYIVQTTTVAAVATAAPV